MRLSAGPIPQFLTTLPPAEASGYGSKVSGEASGEAHGHYLAFTRPLFGLYTAIIRPLHGHYSAFTRPLFDLYTAITRPLHGHYPLAFDPFPALTKFLNARPKTARFLSSRPSPANAFLKEIETLAETEAFLKAELWCSRLP